MTSDPAGAAKKAGVLLVQKDEVLSGLLYFALQSNFGFTIIEAWNRGQIDEEKIAKLDLFLMVIDPDIDKGTIEKAFEVYQKLPAPIPIFWNKKRVFQVINFKSCITLQ